jgi:hypothetical protein
MNQPKDLNLKEIFWFWLPLAASWGLMTLEGPTIQATISRLPEAKIMLAAAGIVLSMEITFESPIIMLLATSTALAKTPQAYRMLSRFVLHLNILLTIIAGTVAFANPVYNWLIPGVMGIPTPIAEAAQPAMQIMTLWSAAIGWRRFYQGILIRFGQTRQVGYGTAVRLTSVIIAAVLLATLTDWSGIVVGGCVWMVGVLSELMYSWWAVRPVIAAHLSGPDGDSPPLTYRRIVTYHAPLAATSLLSLLVQPLIGAGLARMAFPEDNLAAWPVIFSVLLFFRSMGMALPEVVIALLDSPQKLAPLRRFCMLVAGGASATLAVVTFTPLLTLYLLVVTSVPPALVDFILPGVFVGVLVPALQAIHSWQRGVLMTGNATGDVYWGMGLNLLVTSVGIGLGVYWQTTGASTAALALTVGMIVEMVFLWRRVQPVQARLLLLPGIAVV